MIGGSAVLNDLVSGHDVGGIKNSTNLAELFSQLTCFIHTELSIRRGGSLVAGSAGSRMLAIMPSSFLR